MRRILAHLGALGARSVVLAEDETDLLLFPPLRAGWSRAGQPREVLISGKNDRRVIFGAMNLRTGRCWWLERRHRSGEDFRDFLELLHWHYRGWQMVLLLDEDSSHTAGASQELAAELSVELLWLPKRAPELNPVDALWGQAKDVVSANRQFATIDDHAQRFLRHLESLSRQQILQTAGVLSRNFWLRSVLSKDFCGVA
jgi:transposase